MLFDVLSHLFCTAIQEIQKPLVIIIIDVLLHFFLKYSSLIFLVTYIVG